MSLRILIVEDNPDTSDLLRYLLEAFGHSVELAWNGVEALRSARETAPDLILCDIQLPEMDGHEIVRRLKQDRELQTIPVIALTAFAMVGDRDRILASGFNGYLSKPISPETFVPEVEAFIERHKSSERIGRMEADPGSDAIASAPVNPTQTGGILVVDDIRANLEMERAIFASAGYRVHTAGGMSEALAVARRVSPNLVLTDLHMPDGNGFALVRAMRADPDLSSTAVVFLSGTVFAEEDRATALSLGAQRFLRKPIPAAALLEEVQQVLAQFSNINLPSHA